MTKKKVVVKRCVVKKPCPKKDGVVAKRAEKKPLKLKAKDKEKKKKKTVQFVSPVKPARLKRLGSRKRKEDTDRRLRYKKSRLSFAQNVSISDSPDFDESVEIDLIYDKMGDDELAVELGLGVDANDVVALLNGDRVTGDNGIPD